MAKLMSLVAFLALAVVASAQTDCTGVVSDIVKGYGKNSTLVPVFLDIIPAKFNGTALIPTTKAFETALTAILQAASTKAKVKITEIPAGIDAVKLLSSPAVQELIKLHLLYTYGSNPGSTKILNVATALKPTDKKLCPAGPKDTSVDISADKTFTFTFKTSVGSATGLDAIYSQKANCKNAGAFLVDTVLLPCNLADTAVVKLIADAAVAQAKVVSSPAAQPSKGTTTPTTASPAASKTSSPAPTSSPAKNAGAQTAVSGLVLAVLMAIGLMA